MQRVTSQQLSNAFFTSKEDNCLCRSLATQIYKNVSFYASMRYSQNLYFHILYDVFSDIP